MPGISTVRGMTEGRIYGRVEGATGTFVGRGATVARPGPGTYVFTFTSENQMDPTETMWDVAIQQAGTLSLVPTINHASDSTMTITTRDETGAPQDRDFKLWSREFPPDAE